MTRLFQPTLRRYICLIAICFSTSISAQSPIDSLQQIYTDLNQPDSTRFTALDTYYKRYRQSEPEATLNAMRYHKKLARAKNNKLELWFAISRESNFPQIIGFESALALKTEGLEIARELQMEDKIALTLANRAVILLNLGKHLEGVREYNKALTIFRKLDMQPQAAWLLSNIGIVNLKIGNYDIALDYFDQYEKDYKKYEFTDIHILAQNYQNKGRAYRDKKNYTAALLNFDKALEITLEIDDKLFFLENYRYVAETHYNLKQFHKASNYAQQYLQHSKELDFENDVLKARLLLAEITHKAGVGSVTKETEDILKEISEDSDNETKVRVYNLLYSSYKLEKNPNLAVKMLELASVYQDSLDMEIDRLAISRELIKQEYELELAKNQEINNLEKTAIRTKQRKNLITIIIIAVSLILVFFVYYNFKINKDKAIKTKLLDKIQQLKNKTHQEYVIHDSMSGLSKDAIESYLKKPLNDTDWKVLNVLMENPVSTNKEIAEKVFLSVDGIGSSLRRMYEYFDIQETKYKKIALLLAVIKISKGQK